jgi:ribosome-binding factor A
MAREYSRTLRVGEQIQRELAQLIQQEIKDPRVGMVTVADVEVTTDLAHARVYVSVLGEHAETDQGKAEGAVAALNHAAGFLRHELSRRLSTRTIPALRFIHDQTTENANRLAALIHRSVADGTPSSED